MSGNEFQVSQSQFSTGIQADYSVTSSQQGSKQIQIPIGQQAQQKELQPPKKPVATKTKEVEIKDGDTLLAIANKYHTTVADIMALNPSIKNENSLRIGQKVTIKYIPDAEWNKYQSELKAYEHQEAVKSEEAWKAEQAQKLKAKISLANEKISIAKSQDYAKYYDFKVDQSNGNIIVTLKAARTLGDMRSDFRLPGGHLREMNPSITEKYEPDTKYNIGGPGAWRVNDWDACEAQKGDSFIISPDKMNPSKGFWGNLLD